MVNRKIKFKKTEIGMIPEDWEINKLRDATVEIFSGGTPNTRIEEYWNGNLPWLSSGETRQTFIRDTERKITKKGVDNSSTRLALKGDVVVAGAGQGHTRGQPSLCSIDTYINQSVIALRVDKRKLTPFFLFYNLLSRYGELRQLSDAQSSRGSLTTKLLADLFIKHPRLEEQEVISKILLDLDLKIELNQQMNKTLEAIGQALFKHWFVDFEFPNKKGKPYKSSGGEMINSELGMMPKGWKIGKLGEVLSLLKDGSHNPPKRTTSGIKFIAGASDLSHFEINFDNCTYISEVDFKKMHRFWELEENDILLTIVGTVGNVAIVKKSDIPFSLQRSIAILRANEKISSTYLYFLLTNSNFKRFLSSRVNPTAQPGIYLGTLSKMGLIIPSENVLMKYNSLAKSIIISMQNNCSENKNLIQIRESLLPNLMSGKIRVPIEARK